MLFKRKLKAIQQVCCVQYETNTREMRIAKNVYTRNLAKDAYKIKF